MKHSIDLYLNERDIYQCVFECALAKAMAWKNIFRKSDICMTDYGSLRASKKQESTHTPDKKKKKITAKNIE